MLEASPRPRSLTRAIHDRTQGVPFFVEELARALSLTGSLQRRAAAGWSWRGRRRAAAGHASGTPCWSAPSELSEEARAAAEAAAVAGEAFDDATLVAAAVERRGARPSCSSAESSSRTAPGAGAFRHALTREALYADRPVAAAARAPPPARRGARGRRERRACEVATHWLGAREEDPRARGAAARRRRVAGRARPPRCGARRAPGARPLARGRRTPKARSRRSSPTPCSAELAGSSPRRRGRGARSAAMRAEAGARSYAEAQRRLAAVCDLQGRPRARRSPPRRAAAEAFDAAAGPPTRRWSGSRSANYLRAGANYSAAIEMAQAAAARCRRGGAARPAAAGARPRGGRARQARRLRRGPRDRARRARDGARARPHAGGRRPLPAPEPGALRRRRLPAGAGDARHRARAVPDRASEPGTEVACVTCMVYVLRECGEWPEALRLGRELIDSDTAVWVAEGLVGMIYVASGQAELRAPAAGVRRYAAATRVDHFNMSVDSTGGLARVAAAEGAATRPPSAAGRCSSAGSDSEDHHYAVKGLRWGAGVLRPAGGPCGRAARAPRRWRGSRPRPAMPTRSPRSRTRSARRRSPTATPRPRPSRSGTRSSCTRGLDLPFERAEIELRAGVALAAAGEREPALDRLGERLPHRAQAGREAARGRGGGRGGGTRRVGGPAPGPARGGGRRRRWPDSGRELEVMRLVAVGRTNREIAEQLVPEPAHRRHARAEHPAQADCRSRVEAAHRAGELGLLA